MAVAANLMHGCGPSNEMRHQLQPKKTTVRLYWPLILQQKASFALYITSKTKDGPCHRYNAWMWCENNMCPQLQLKKIEVRLY